MSQTVKSKRFAASTLTALNHTLSPQRYDFRFQNR